MQMSSGRRGPAPFHAALCARHNRRARPGASGLCPGPAGRNNYIDRDGTSRLLCQPLAYRILSDSPSAGGCCRYTCPPVKLTLPPDFFGFCAIISRADAYKANCSFAQRETKTVFKRDHNKSHKSRRDHKKLKSIKELSISTINPAQ